MRAIKNRYTLFALAIWLSSCGSSSVLNARRYDASRTSLFTLDFEDRNGHTFLYKELYGANAHGSYSDISPTERVLRSHWQDVTALPALLDSVRVPLASSNSTYVLLTTSIDTRSLGFYRDILSFVVETPHGTSAPVSYLDPSPRAKAPRRGQSPRRAHARPRAHRSEATHQPRLVSVAACDP